MAPDKSSPDKSQAQPAQAEKLPTRFEQLTKFSASPEREARLAKVRKLERISRIHDDKVADTFLAALDGSRGQQEEKGPRLSQEQEKVVHDAIKGIGQGEEEQKALRESFMGSTKDQEVFTGLVQRWMEEEKLQPEGKKRSKQEIAKLKGNEYIKLYRKQMLHERGNLFYEKNAKAENLTEELKTEQKEKLYKALDLYVQANRDQLAVLNSLPTEDLKKVRDGLLAKFAALIGENGFDLADKGVIADIEILFNQIAGDEEYYDVAVKEYEMTVEEMLLMMEEGLTPEEWEARRQQALKKKTAELKETPAQQSQPVYAAGAAVDTVGATSYESLNEVAKTNMVHFDPVPGKKDEYTVKYTQIPEINDLFQPFVRIYYEPPQAKDMKHIRFELKNPWMDSESAEKGRPFGADTSVRIENPARVVSALNMLALKWVFNMKINLKGSDSPNIFINDRLTHLIAGRLLAPFNIDEDPLDKERLQVFERFMTVVLRNDPKNDSLELRVRKVERELINNDANVGHLQEIFKSDGAPVMTLDSLIGEIETRKKGIKS